MLNVKGLIIKNYNAIINGKKFYDKAVDPDVKRSEEIKKLITRQGRRLYYWMFTRLRIYQKPSQINSS